ncbi:MAG: hypothetical protein ACR2K2_11335 [Mycobacteriales bacterium]
MHPASRCSSVADDSRSSGTHVACLVRRFRRSVARERQQLRWVAVGGVCAVLGIAASSASQDAGLGGVLAGLAAAAGIGTLPTCIAVAVLRYRLYDLGRLVSRTVSYAVVTALLLGAYLTPVTTSARLAPGSSSLAVAAFDAGSRCALPPVAARRRYSKRPLRRRVQHAVDHRFNRSRCDADRTVDAFSRRLRDEVDLDTVRADLLHVVRDTVQPPSVALLLRSQ